MDFKQQLKTAYNEDAKRRDSNESKRDQWKLELRQQFAEVLKKENKKTILELGSGAGIDAKFFQDQEFSVLATDLSEEMIKMCKKRGVDAKVIDLYEISSLGQKFDAIYSLNVLLHVPKKDLGKILKTIHEALNNDGVFFYGVYGGIDEETTITDKTKMNLPRLFSFMSDESLKESTEELFSVINFKTIDIGSNRPGFHFQSLLLRKR